MITPADLEPRLAAAELVKHPHRYVPSMSRGIPNTDIGRDYRRALRRWNKP